MVLPLLKLSLMNKKIFILIFLLAFAIRIFRFDHLPLLWDEASLGYNAYSILKTGKDEQAQALGERTQSEEGRNEGRQGITKQMRPCATRGGATVATGKNAEGSSPSWISLRSARFLRASGLRCGVEYRRAAPLPKPGRIR